ncbi:MAG: hypothetical protein JXA83_04495 [Acidimicrobiales bacterium]|nr:hypothetical protein [Acidimicrobiales bacterium]
MTSPSEVAGPAGPRGATSAVEAVELRKEAYTMALYVAVCLLAALTATADRTADDHVTVLGIVWGTTVGLALAHWFAFRVSARLVAAGTVRRHDAAALGAQLAGALSVAVLATVPVVVFPASAEMDTVRLLLAGFIAAMGFAVARASGASTVRALGYAATILVAASTIAVVKNLLAGH